MLSRRFLPLFLTQALGAFNDNLLKNAMVILVVLGDATNGPILVAAAGGAFILPYVLVSPFAGQHGDRLAKPRLIVLTKTGELALMLVGAIALLTASVGGLFLVLLGLGVQAAFFGPLKYGILPELLPPEFLLRGNALVEAGTFLAILLARSQPAC